MYPLSYILTIPPTIFPLHRALAAEEHSRKLQRIQKSKVAKDDTGNVKKSLQSAQEDAQTEAQHFQQLAQTIRVELGVPLAEFVTKQREARKLVNIPCPVVLKFK